MDWSDVLRGALSFFLVITGIGLAYLLFRMAGVFGRVGTAVTQVTGEVLPILTKTQTTVDGVNLELARVDEMMQTAVHTTKGAERAVTTVTSTIAAPVRKIAGFAAGAKEAVATMRAQRAATRVAPVTAMPPAEPTVYPSPVSPAPAPVVGGAHVAPSPVSEPDLPPQTPPPVPVTPAPAPDAERRPHSSPY